MVVRSDRRSQMSPASATDFSYTKRICIYTRLHGIPSYTTVFCIQSCLWAVFIYVFYLLTDVSGYDTIPSSGALLPSD
jgi:hypothetical protein